MQPLWYLFAAVAELMPNPSLEPRRYGSQDEASMAGKAAVIEFLGSGGPKAAEPGKDVKNKS